MHSPNYAVFVSHASLDRSEEMTLFVKILDDRVGTKTGHDATKVTFLDSRSIGTGIDWVKCIADAVRTSETLACLITPRYLGSTWCGLELEVFHSRYVEYCELQGSKNTLGFVFPILWDVKPTCVLPKKLARFQNRSADMPANYAKRGLHWMMDCGSKKEWKKVIHVLAEQIRDALLDPVRLPVGDVIADFKTVVNAFQDEPLPYEAVLLVVAAQEQNWKPKPDGPSVLETAGSLRLPLHLLRANDVGQTKLTELEKGRQVLLVVADLGDAKPGNVTLDKVNKSAITNFALVLVDAAGAAPTALGDWAAAFPAGSLAVAVAGQRAICCPPSQLPKTLEQLATEVKLMLIKADPAAKAEDPKTVKEAQDRAIAVHSVPYLTGPASEKTNS